MFSSQLLLIGFTGLIGGAMNSIAGGGTILTFPALIFAGLNPVLANATSTVALLPGTLASIAAYRRNFGAVRFWLVVFGPGCLLGGLAGSMLLVITPNEVFAHLVPALLLFATVLFMAGGVIRKLTLGKHDVTKRRHSTKWIVGAAIFQFLVGVYGGYFGAGIGILMLASYGILGFQNIHEMNTLKSILASVTNGAAAIYFMCTLPIAWKEAGVLTIGTVIGGYAGAAVAQKIPQSAVRVIVSLIGLSLAAVLFFKK